MEQSFDLRDQGDKVSADDAQITICSIRQRPQLLEDAAAWFHAAWGIPLQAYRDSMRASLTADAVPQWYVALAGGQIVAGLGVIENDFHDRKDLTPNVCAVYTLPDWRCKGLAGALLRHVCRACAQKGIPTLYLLTDHTAFYERYGWQFYCMAQGDGEKTPSRMYVHHQDEG